MMEEKEPTPEESPRVMQRMAGEAQEGVHFTGRPFLYAGWSLVGLFLVAALLYTLWPERQWIKLLALYPVLHVGLWYWGLPQDGDAPVTLADRVIEFVWRGVFMGVLMVLLYGLTSRAHGELVPPLLMVLFCVLVYISSATNDDQWGIYLALPGFIGALTSLFRDEWSAPGRDMCLTYAALFALLLLGMGYRSLYVARHPEKRKRLVRIDE